MWVLKFGVSGSNTDAVCTGVKKNAKTVPALRRLRSIFTAVLGLLPLVPGPAYCGVQQPAVCRRKQVLEHCCLLR
jgi:hypothetical protein